MRKDKTTGEGKQCVGNTLDKQKKGQEQHMQVAKLK